MVPTLGRLALRDLQSMPGGVESLGLFCAPAGEPLRGLAGLVDWRLAGALGRARAAGLMAGQPGEMLLLPATGRLRPGRIFLFGLGPAAGWNAAWLAHWVPQAVAAMRRAQVVKVGLAVPEAAAAPSGADAAFVAALAALPATLQVAGFAAA